MAYTKSHFTPDGMARRGTWDNFRILMNDVPAAFTDSRGYIPAEFLPALIQEPVSNEYYTLQAGTICAVNSTLTRSSLRRLVPANGGATGVSVVYTSNDIGKTDDVASATETPVVTATAVNSGVDYPANFPVGWTMHHLWGSYLKKLYYNYAKQYEQVALITDQVVLVGLENDSQDSIAEGRHVMPSSVEEILGKPKLWTNGSDSVDQLAGRCLSKFTIKDGTSSISRLDLVNTVGGLELPGRDTSGRPADLFTKREDTQDLITQAVIIRAVIA